MEKTNSKKNKKHKMPVLFIGHGSPINAIEKNEFSLGWKKIADEIPKPRLILCISAHWLSRNTKVTAMEDPKTIYDFYGFPEELYNVKYDVNGSPKDALFIKNLIKSTKVFLDNDWGLDHGTWSVLRNMYPKADIPVLQLSIDFGSPLKKHFEIGKELSILRENGVLIIGSGNIVHNLMMFRENEISYPWAIDFDKFVKEKLQERDYNALIDYTKNKASGYAQPTNDHYLPLLYVIGASNGDEPKFFNNKVISSISMTSVIYN